MGVEFLSGSTERLLRQVQVETGFSSAEAASHRDFSTKDPLVSVVIPTFNSGKHLGRCLESVVAQSYSSIETLVVDNYSCDETADVARSYRVSFIRYRGNAASARNIGVSKSRGRFVLLLDADQALQSFIVKECVDVLSDDRGVKAIIVPERSVGVGFWVAALGFEKRLVASDVSAAMPRFFRAEVLAELGVDESLVFGEDWDLYLRFKQRGFKAKGIGSHMLHYESDTLLGILVKSLKYGLSFRRLVGKQGAVIYRRYTFLPVSPIRFVRCFREDPVHGVGFLVLRFLRGVLFGVGAAVGSLGVGGRK